MATVGPDAVVLDLARDRYLCLPDSAEAIQARPGSARVHPDWVEPLTDAGLILMGPEPPARSLPPEVRRELSPAGAPFSASDQLAFLRAVLTAVRLGPVVRIDRLRSALTPAPSTAADPARVAALVGLFRAGLPWVPRQGACLWRAFLLLSLLRRAGQTAVWVFGVRTWPFSAHCWLQLDDAVLDDDPGRVGLYTPILAL